MLRSSTLLLLAITGLMAEEIPDLTVGVSRLARDPVEQPVTLYRIEGDLYQREAHRGAVDALASSPGVFVQRTAGNQASPYVRGLTGEQTLLLFDGVRLSHATMRPGPNQYSSLLTPEAVGGVDVLMGGGGAVQGSDGLTGAVDFRQATAGRGVKSAASPWISGRADVADGYRTSGGLDGRLPLFDYSVEAGRTDHHDRRGGKDAGDHLFGASRGDRTIPNSGYRQVDGGGRVALTQLPGQRVEISAGRTLQSDAPRADGYAANSNDTNRISRYYDHQAFTYVHARHILVGHGAMPRIQTTWWRHEHAERQVREDTNPNGANAPVRYRRREYDDRVTTRGLDVQLTHALDAHQVTWGGTWYQDVTSNDYRRFRSPNGNFTASASVLDSTDAGQTTVPDGSSLMGTGLFAQDLWTLSDAWDVLAGLRWSRTAWNADVTATRPGFTTARNLSDDVDATTGHLRLGFHPVARATLHAGVSQGFRAPNLSNLAGVQDRGSSNLQVEGNGELKPERSITYEIGAKWQDGRDAFSLALFVTDLSDLIQVQYEDVDGNGQITGADRARTGNAESGRLAGIELGHDLGLPVELPAGMRLAVVQTASAITGEMDQELVTAGTARIEEVHISRANRVWGSAGLRFEPSPAWYTLAQVRWTDAYDEVNPGDANDVRHTTFAAKGKDAGAMPGYAVADLKAGWRSAGDGVRIDAAIDNLLDTSYREVGSGIDGAGLNAMLAATFRY